ncbi:MULTISPECIES: hypothetical protein [unclassified Corynebacterium]|uniref:hypothetical protein n=1 Tax=unclassified Corynebacterium TaxID=2624378 RepID=UPI0029CA3D18|nr:MULTISPECIES: hypothetical protein [unclassified Corynebacterium]WPF66148.1 hypothetical protein OLX12_11475 [Corynebacterium sp. 22KM0430]WPF68641.1 hypothetical protein OLW90_11475 [Corynebacterium sp. 21KM1197]
MILPGFPSRRALLRPLSLAAVTTTAALCSAFPLMPSAQADVLPLSPTSETSREAWINPLVRPNEEDSPVRVELLHINGGTQAHLESGQELRLSVRVRNTSDAPVEQLTLQLRRAAAVSTVAEARQAIAQDLSAYSQILSPVVLPDSLDPGEEREVELRASTTPGVGESLALEPGSTYPVAVAASGVVGTNSSPTTNTTQASAVQPLSTERFVVDTNPRPASSNNTPAPEAEANANTETNPDNPQGLSLLYPLSEPTHIVPGETGEAPEAAPLILSEDSLAHSLASGGRLHSLLSAYERALASSQVAESTCLALDPALLSTVNRMQGGYTVAKTRHSLGQPTRRLRDSWGSRSEDQTGTPGTGSQAAQAWLERLSHVAAQQCVVALPWANADLDAVQRTANPWLMREALQRGQEVISQVLGVQPQRGVVVPGSGYVSEATVPSLAWADQEGDLTQAWEAHATQEEQRAEHSPDTERGSDSTLDSPALPDATSATHPQAPQQPVSVVVANNTVWAAPEVDRFAQIAPGIRAVTYPASLAATLAATGEEPATAGYSNPEGRFDPTLDSATARHITAAAALRRSVEESRLAEQPMLVTPPAALSAETGAMLLTEVDSALSSQRARPMSLSAYLTPEASQAEDLAALVAATPAPGENPRLGAPFLDPSVYSDAEVLRTTQQANYTDDLTGLMMNDPSIALTRYAFTAPLRQDLLAALSVTRRRSVVSFNDAVSAASRRLSGNREVLQGLRGSVTLLPPGNVYTRTSESSPLLIVAKNGLPLPVDATMRYHTAQQARITVPTHLRIPARGSITVNMTADIAKEDEQAQMDLWLASSDGSTISDPVRIAVQTRASLVGASALIVGLGGLLLAVTLFRVGRSRRRQRR